MKKSLLLFVFCCTLSFVGNAQSDSDVFVRKGRVLVETGYNLVAGFSDGTGLSVIVDSDGESVTSFGFDGGYFISEDFALKMNLSILSSGGSLTNFGIGGKYYIGGTVPVEIGGGVLSGGGFSDFLGSLSVGYAANIAPNIALEPTIGILVSDGSVLEFGLTFAMFL